MNKFYHVFKYEFFTSLKDKAFLISTAITLVLIIAGTNIPRLISIFSSGDKKDEKTAIVFDAGDNYKDEELNLVFGQHKWTRTSKEDEVKILAEDETYDLGIVFSDASYKIYIKTESMGDFFSQSAFNNLVRSKYQANVLEQKGFTELEIEEFTNKKITGEFINVGKDISKTFWIAYVLLFLLYMSTIMYGQKILMSVIVEKSTKTMELLITSVSTNALIFGKVFANASVALLQFLLIIITAVVSFLMSSSSWANFSEKSTDILAMAINPSIIILAIVFFLIGFFEYAFMYAGLGSTVSRLEESQSVATIPMFLVMAGFMTAIFSLGSPNNTFTIVASYLPFLSPFVMFMRIVVSDISVLSIAIAISINLITIVVVGIIAARIYSVGVLMYGKSPSIFKLIKYVVLKK